MRNQFRSSIIATFIKCINITLFILCASHAMDSPMEGTEKCNLVKKSDLHGVETYEMSSILGLGELVKSKREKNPEAKILVALDWDNTVSLVDGTFFPLREGYLTQYIIYQIFGSYKAEPFILTSRCHGLGMAYAGFSASEASYKMHRQLPTLYKTKIFKEWRVCNFSIPNKLDKSSETLGEAMIFDGVLFAGSANLLRSAKGSAIAYLTDGAKIQHDNGAFTTLQLNYDYLIFVDDLYLNIDDFALVFADRPDKSKITLVHYPQVTPDNLENKGVIPQVTQNKQIQQAPQNKQIQIKAENLMLLPPQSPYHAMGCMEECFKCCTLF